MTASIGNSKKDQKKRLAVVEKEKYTETEINSVSFSYANSLSVKKLLDNIAAIIAAEYINTGKQNPKIFYINGDDQ
ncbi:MAG: hypothetical protein ACYCXQ_08205 [Candidatus Humimicrobiaceae bacterium]